MQSRLRTLAVIVAAIILAAGTYIAYEKYSRRTHVIAMVQDAAERLKNVLERAVAGSANPDLQAHATAVESHASTLRRMNTASFSPLADAADDYLVTAREIMKRSLQVQLAAARLEQSRDALAAHLQNDRGAAAWTGEAMLLKQTLDRELRDYRLGVEAYSTLLESLPASQARVRAYIDDAPAVESSTLQAAARRTLDAYAAAEQNVKEVADLRAYSRGRR